MNFDALDKLQPEHPEGLHDWKEVAFPKVQKARERGCSYKEIWAAIDWPYKYDSVTSFNSAFCYWLRKQKQKEKEVKK